MWGWWFGGGATHNTMLASLHVHMADDVASVLSTHDVLAKSSTMYRVCTQETLSCVYFEC